MAAADVPTPDDLRQLLYFDPDTGLFIWKARSIDYFPTKKAQKQWNGRFAGKTAFITTGNNGYLFGCFIKKKLLAHRVAWAIHYGEWPKGQIDHVNGDRHDNRISNLRQVTRSENMRNAKRPTTNTSGAIGVHWNGPGNNWRVRIGREHVGVFDRFEDAVEARRLAELRKGYHKNHGR